MLMHVIAHVGCVDTVRESSGHSMDAIAAWMYIGP